MIYLDTNAFYYAAGISEPNFDVGKLRQFIEMHEVAISAVSLYEFAMKYRNDIEKIHIGGDFLGKQHIKIGFNKYFPVPRIFPEFWNVITEQQLKDFLDGIIENKIDVEARYASLCFSICFISIADFMVNEVSDGECMDYYYCSLRNIMKMMNDNDIELFKKLFNEGYKTDDCENHIRKCFDNYMAFWLQCFVPILQKANEVESHEEFLELEKQVDWNVMSQDMTHRIDRNVTTMQFVKKKAAIYWKNMKDDHLKDFLSKLRESVDKKIKETALQEYLMDIIEGFLLNGASFWKNDILDAIIMCSLNDEEDILVTFDEGAITHMKKYSSSRKSYRDSLEIIKGLKK